MDKDQSAKKPADKPAADLERASLTRAEVVGGGWESILDNYARPLLGDKGNVIYGVR